MPITMKTWQLIAVCFLAAAVLPGCSAKAPTYLDRGASYSDESVKSLYAQVDITAISKQVDPNVVEMRHNALTALRRQGGEAADAASIITNAFPADMRGIPVYVERAAVNGTRALIVVEATGPVGAPLTLKRLWVLGLDGTVIFAGSQ
ncbi:MAG: hypothetical protein HGA39_03575 [Coriobacteriia bacterium]|nr:hypothetical protein [Coriobacteriia bacterium]